MIPKKIHYCWFGGNPLPKSARKYIKTWKKYFPDYEIIEWNEDNFSINYNDYVNQAYMNKKYAFVADVARLYALKQQGGIYFDTDIEILRRPDNFFQNGEVIMAFESNRIIMTGFFAAKKDNKFIADWLNSYDSMKFLNDDGSFDETPNTFRVSSLLKQYGMIENGEKQELSNGVIIYPKEIFGAYDVDNSGYVINKDTVLVHHCKNSWMPLSYKVKDVPKRLLAKCIGVERVKKVRKIIKG